MKLSDIICRIWDQENRVMVYGDFQFWFDCNGELKDTPPLNYPLIEIMFFTGLTDRKGKKAFHKDIIKRYGQLYVLEWHNNRVSWYLQTMGGGWQGLTKYDFTLTCEIMGNIFEKKLNRFSTPENTF